MSRWCRFQKNFFPYRQWCYTTVCRN